MARVVARIGRDAASRSLVVGRCLGKRACLAMIALQNLTVNYRQHPALHHVSGHFEAGSLTAVVGPNGAGKSTLLKSIVGCIPRIGGTLKVNTPSQRIAYLPQLAEIDRGFPIQVRDCVMLGFWSTSGPWSSMDDGTLRSRVDAALKAVGLEGFEKRPIGTLSSGQLQRVLFARLMVQDAELILLDEPFNAVDSRTTQVLLELIGLWGSEKRTVIAVLHDDAHVREFFPNTLLLARQVIAWGPTDQVLTPTHLNQARLMAEAWDEDAAICLAQPKRMSAVAP